MTQSPESARSHRFAGWELRPHERVLLVRGEPARIGGRAFNLLLALVERQGRVASKDELLDAAWPGLVVEENNLSVQIAALRKLLGAGVIVNVSGVGYRLAVPADPEEGAGGRAMARPDARQHLASALPLFGREPDFDALLLLIGVAPLVTIVGTGGVGKTSLARAAVGRTPREWPDGVHWIDLAPLRSGAPLTQLVAKSLGVLPDEFGAGGEDLTRSLSQIRALIALDNCEHLLDDVAGLLGPLLQRAPGLRWCATSQEPLHVAGETVYRLGPLAVPQPGAVLEQATDCGAMALFCERARAADSRFELGIELLPTAIAVCRQLDGLPLAIEMAAAQVGTLGLQGVHDQLDQRLRLRAGMRDAPARHHTLLQTFEWSYGLLSPLEQGVFRSLEPFLGSFSVTMAQELCCALEGGAKTADKGAALEALAALIDKSLVQRVDAGNGAARLYLLESARDFARMRLDAENETSAVRRAHAEVLARWFDTAHTDLQRWRDRDWEARYMPERRNVCGALAWACSARQPELLARLVAALAQLDTFAQAPAEVLQYAVPVDVLALAPLPVRARAHLEFGWSHFLDGSREFGTELALSALADFEALEDLPSVSLALAMLVRLCLGRPGMQDKAREMWSRLQQIDECEVPLRTRLYCDSNLPYALGGTRSVERLQQFHRIAQQAGFDVLAAICRVNITDELLLQGRFAEVVDTARAMLDGDESRSRMRALVCQNQALALVRLGRAAEAQAAARAMLRALPSAAHMVMDLFALAAVQAGRCDDAALMAGCSARIKRERDRRSEPAEAAVIADTLQQLRAALGPERCAELMRLGAGMATADILAMALPN